MECTANNFALLFARKFIKVNCVTGYTNCKVRILFRIFVSVHQSFAVKYVNVNVVSLLSKVTVKNRNKVVYLLVIGWSERNDRIYA